MYVWGYKYIKFKIAVFPSGDKMYCCQNLIYT